MSLHLFHRKQQGSSSETEKTEAADDSNGTVGHVPKGSQTWILKRLLHPQVYRSIIQNSYPFQIGGIT